MTVEQSPEVFQKFVPVVGMQANFDVLALMKEGLSLAKSEQSGNKTMGRSDSDSPAARVDRPTMEGKKDLPEKKNETAKNGEKDAPGKKLELPDKAELDRRAKEKQEIELLDSMATLIDAKGDNKYALKLLFGDLPLETTVNWPVSKINDKLEALGSDKRVSFRGNPDGTRSLIVYHTEMTTPKSSKYTVLYDVTVTPKKK